VQKLVREAALVAVKELHRAIPQFHANPSSTTIPDRLAPKKLAGTSLLSRIFIYPNHGQAIDLGCCKIRVLGVYERECWPARNSLISPIHLSAGREIVL
jgi:hypothetical protein